MKTASLAAGAEVSAELSAAVRHRRKIRYGLKLALGLGLLAWLVVKGGWQGVAARLSGVSLEWFAFALLVYLVGQTLCSWKWSLLARSVGFPRPMRFFWVNYLGGMFASLFLPTSVGGDVFRAIALIRTGADKISASVSVLADRGTGVLAMVWIATLASAALPGVPMPGWIVQCLAGLCAVLTLGFLVPFWWRPGFTRGGVLGRVFSCWEHPRLLLVSLGTAFAFQVLVSVIYLLLGEALSIDIDPVFYFLLSPVVSVIAMSPVTVNGLGVREWALVLLFPLVGVEPERAVAFGLAWTALVTLASLFGGLVLFFAERQGGWAVK